jgi:hypothetical protein
MAREFAKGGIDSRVDILESLAGETGEWTAKEAAKRLGYERALRTMHERLRKVGR